MKLLPNSRIMLVSSYSRNISLPLASSMRVPQPTIWWKAMADSTQRKNTMLRTHGTSTPVDSKSTVVAMNQADEVPRKSSTI